MIEVGFKSCLLDNEISNKKVVQMSTNIIELKYELVIHY